MRIWGGIPARWCLIMGVVLEMRGGAERCVMVMFWSRRRGTWMSDRSGVSRWDGKLDLKRGRSLKGCAC